jgi:shikimate 5-dehydrogenase
MTRSFTFIGVTTGDSSIMRIFPRWREVLGLGADVEMVGWDIELGAPPRRYRDAVARLKEDSENLGALVTTHKIGVYQGARDLFDRLDDNARLCEEVSCIAKRDGALAGWAKDPVAAGRSLDLLLDPHHFSSSGADALCMGAGGSGVAIAVYLGARRPDAPRRIVLTDVSAARLERLEAVANRVGIRDRIEHVLNDGHGVHERILTSLAPNSLVVNATGWGKDRPGSPLSRDARFPEGAVAWELNYRGSLEFLRQAEAQRGERGLVVEDGWRYFIRGWTSVMEEVFERRIGDDEIERLSREAEFARPRRREE